MKDNSLSAIPLMDSVNKPHFLNRDWKIFSCALQLRKLGEAMIRIRFSTSYEGGDEEAVGLSRISNTAWLRFQQS